MSDVVIIDSGVANLASITSAFRRLGTSVEVSAEPERVRTARRLVLPGVGAFGAGIAALDARGLGPLVRQAAEHRTPLLAVCLGLQLLCEASEETPGPTGLGIIAGACRRLPDGARVPHLGWNRVDAGSGAQLVATGEAAFAHSYALLEAPAGWSVSWSWHGAPFVAALERDSTLACQFHPELSGTWGLALLERWLAGQPADRGAEPVARPRGVIRRLVPCLDVRDGRVVKGIRFQDVRDAGDPVERAARYEAEGADEIVVLDIAASPTGRETQIETVRRVRAVLGIPLTVGGGVRTVEDARRLLAAGADRVSVNTAASQRPALLGELAREFGCQCVVLAIDARRAGGGWEVLVNGGRDAGQRDVVEWARRGVELGAGEILLTSWDRDGTGLGHDLELLRAVTAAVSVPVIASGGIGGRADVAEAFAAGAEAVLAASIFHDGEDTVAGVKAELQRRGLPVRR